MNGAIMQPYFFPYIGYYQLVFAGKNFVFLDDVNFIKKGFINRNSILYRGEICRFTIPVTSMSQNRKINEHSYFGDFSSFIRLIHSAYKSSPFYNSVIPFIEEITNDKNKNVAHINSKSIMKVFEYLGINCNFIYSSCNLKNSQARGQQRIIDLCNQLKFDTYINPIGGMDLYDKSLFNDSGIDLCFLSSYSKPYKQSNTTFTPNLSIIDALMNCSKDEIIEILGDYSIV